MKLSKLMIALTLTTGAAVTGIVIADSDRYNERYSEQNEYRGSQYERRYLDVAPVTSKSYQESCGECHMAYQPGFLPARSWEKLMGSLDDHFDENAEVDANTQQQLTEYLTRNAADFSDYKRSRAMMNALSSGETPIRISETRYFIRKHDELPKRLVENNPDVKSFSRCEACHTDANKGSYDEHRVRIPGYGLWED